jgi:DNA-binding response OmpR family regulator
MAILQADRTDSRVDAKTALRGRPILVLEDDVFQAFELTEALSEAGARVIGPFEREDAALDAIANEPLAAAILDINIDGRPAFEAAGLLKLLGVPFVFLTGYDRGILPPEFASIDCAEKPIAPCKLVDILARVMS